MKKIIVFAISSAVSLIGGLFLIISNINKLSDQSSTTPFALGFFLLIFALVLLLVTIRAVMGYIVERNKDETAVETVIVQSQNLIQRNSDIVNDWEKTNQARDKLKMLKMVGSAEEQQ